MDIAINIVGIHVPEIIQALTTTKESNYPSMSGELMKKPVFLRLLELDNIGSDEYGREDYNGTYELTAKNITIKVEGTVTPIYKEFTCDIKDVPEDWLEDWLILSNKNK